MADTLRLPELKITAKKPQSNKPSGIEVQVSKIGVLGTPGMDRETQEAFKRMLYKLEQEGK